MTDGQKVSMQHLRDFIALRCLQIEREWEKYGLSKEPRVTVLVRDPDNLGMCCIVTNEGEGADIGAVAARVHVAASQFQGYAGDEIL